MRKIKTLQVSSVRLRHIKMSVATDDDIFIISLSGHFKSNCG